MYIISRKKETKIFGLFFGLFGLIGGSGVYILGASGVAIIAVGGTDLYCHSEPPLTSSKLCFIINFIGGAARGAEFLLGGGGAAP